MWSTIRGIGCPIHSDNPQILHLWPYSSTKNLLACCLFVSFFTTLPSQQSKEPVSLIRFFFSCHLKSFWHWLLQYVFLLGISLPQCKHLFTSFIESSRSDSNWRALVGSRLQIECNQPLCDWSKDCGMPSWTAKKNGLWDRRGDPASTTYSAIYSPSWGRTRDIMINSHAFFLWTKGELVISLSFNLLHPSFGWMGTLSVPFESRSSLIYYLALSVADNELI